MLLLLKRSLRQSASIIVFNKLHFYKTSLPKQQHVHQPSLMLLLSAFSGKAAIISSRSYSTKESWFIIYNTAQ